MEQNPGWEWHNANGETIEGRTFGGCFEVLCIQARTSKYLPEPEELEDKILVLETSEEHPESFWGAWFMMSLGEQGLLQKFKAILVGRPKTRHFEGPSKEEREKYRKDQKEAIKKNVQKYSPDTLIIFDLDFGHTDPISPLPMGATVQIDTEIEEIVFRRYFD